MIALRRPAQGAFAHAHGHHAEELAFDCAEQVLLAFKEAVKNWDEVFTSRGLVGWSACNDTLCTPLCSWTGVRCSPFGSEAGDRVTSL
jgi:hypothetical protein